jgi:hypothetical protein
MPEIIVRKEPSPTDNRERDRWLRDAGREQMQEAAKREDPALKQIMCRCGHRLGEHYQGTRAMPCGKCACMECTAPRAEDLRRQKARLGVQDVTPLSRVFRKGRG